METYLEECKLNLMAEGMQDEETEKPEDMHMLFANYLCMKIEEGYFPARCLLPKVEELMAAFKLGLTTVLKTVATLERGGIIKFGKDGKAEVIMGPEGLPFPLDVRKDVEEIFGLFVYLEMEIFRKGWVKVNLVELGRKTHSAKSLGVSEKTLFLENAVHWELVRHCGNPTLAHVQEQIFKQIEFFRQMYLDCLNAKELKRNLEAIEFIHDAIFVRDFQGACRKMSELASTRKDELLVFLEKSAVITAHC